MFISLFLDDVLTIIVQFLVNLCFEDVKYNIELFGHWLILFCFIGKPSAARCPSNSTRSSTVIKSKFPLINIKNTFLIYHIVISTSILFVSLVKWKIEFFSLNKPNRVKRCQPTFLCLMWGRFCLHKIPLWRWTCLWWWQEPVGSCKSRTGLNTRKSFRALS